MLIKSADDKQVSIDSLKSLLLQAESTKKSAIKRELNILRAGIKGERESAYLIDFDLERSSNYAVIHDIRIEANGRVAQIDHLLINRALNIYVLETKHFNDGIKITDDGEFQRWNSYKKRWEGMPSPIKQNERHIQVLKDCFQNIKMPMRLGMELTPTFESYVLINPSARIDRSEKFDSKEVIKADMLMQKIRENINPLKTISMITKLVSSETIERLAHDLCKLHQPITTNYDKKFGVVTCAKEKILTATDEKNIREERPIIENNAPLCSKCESNNISIQYGRFGYYFKCADCNGNTSIKLTCDQKHKERVRKKKNQFFRECAECDSSSLYFTNSL